MRKNGNPRVIFLEGDFEIIGICIFWYNLAGKKKKKKEGERTLKILGWRRGEERNRAGNWHGNISD